MARADGKWRSSWTFIPGTPFGNHWNRESSTGAKKNAPSPLPPALEAWQRNQFPRLQGSWLSQSDFLLLKGNPRDSPLRAQARQPAAALHSAKNCHTLLSPLLWQLSCAAPSEFKSTLQSNMPASIERGEQEEEKARKEGVCIKLWNAYQFSIIYCNMHSEFVLIIIPLQSTNVEVSAYTGSLLTNYLIKISNLWSSSKINYNALPYLNLIIRRVWRLIVKTCFIH